ncbi:MAG TPA: hypothetical protein VF647_10625 [Longimicrobium sp.]
MELVMAFEEAFGIGIPNATAERLETPLHMVDYLCTVLPVAPSGPCATQRTFFRLRRALRIAVEGAPPLRTRTRIRDIATRGGWPAAWEGARAAVGKPEWPDVPWGRWPNGGKETLRSVALRLVPRLVPPDVSRGEVWTRERIGLRVREVIVDEIGIADFRMRDEFVRDMRLD